MGTMTKKDFIAIAGIIQRTRHDYSSEDTVKPEYVLNHLARELAGHCRTTNPLFDRDRFLAACGVQS